MAAGSVLVVDDEANIALSLEYLMKEQGFDVRVARDGEAALEALRDRLPDVMLLDVMMPKRDGFDVCQTVRATPEWAGLRIIMLTAKGRAVEQEKGLALGADDYITKPFSLRELLARIKAVLRRAGEAGNAPEASGEVTIGNLTVDFSTYDAYMDERAEPMSHKEFELLKYLWQHQGQTVSRDELLNEVWGYEEFPTTRTVDNFILKLRKRIESDPARPRFILTVHGIGYKLVP